METRTTREQQSLPHGADVDEFVVRRVLGTGGFGVTYEAVEPALDRRVALKEYFPESLAMREPGGTRVHARADGDVDSYEWGLMRFLDEARTLARFHDPHIVHVNRYLQANDTAYLVMNYEDGAPLSEFLKTRRVGERAVLRLLRPLLLGLRAVHAERYLHRDVKPGNVFIRRKGPPLLIDFGAARQALQRKAAGDLTVILTPGYAPLEQYADSDESQGPWTDIYALGATLFHCVTGRAPRDATVRVQALHHGRGDPVREVLNGPTAQCSDGLQELLLWMLQPFAGDRPQTCDAVLEALDRLAHDPAHSTRRHTSARRGDGAQSTGAVARAGGPPDPQSTIVIDGPDAAPSARASSPRVARGRSDTPAPQPPAPASAGPERSSGGGTTLGEPVPASADIAERDLHQAQTMLSDHLGPIAQILVKKAAQSAAGREEFIDTLAEEIEDPQARERFRAALSRR